MGEEDAKRSAYGQPTWRWLALHTHAALCGSTAPSTTAAQQLLGGQHHAHDARHVRDRRRVPSANIRVETANEARGQRPQLITQGVFRALRAGGAAAGLQAGNAFADVGRQLVDGRVFVGHALVEERAHEHPRHASHACRVPVPARNTQRPKRGRGKGGDLGTNSAPT